MVVNLASGESNYVGHRGTENWDLNISCFPGSLCCSVPRGLTFANRTAKPAEVLQALDDAFSPAARCSAGSGRA